MKPEIESLEMELTRLLLARTLAVGMDLKRTNFKIAELQHKIDHAKRLR